MRKSELNDLLLSGVVELVYTKYNGEVREMRCTKSNLILNSPEGRTLLNFRRPTNNLKYNIDNTDNIIVWDLDKKAWRTVVAHKAIFQGFIPESSYYKSLQINQARKI